MLGSTKKMMFCVIPVQEEKGLPGKTSPWCSKSPTAPQGSEQALAMERPRSAHPSRVRQSWMSLGRFGSVQDTARPLQERNLVLRAPPGARSNIWGCLAPGECHDLGHCWGGQGKHRITTLLIFLFQSSARMRSPSQSQLPAQVHGSQQRWEPPALGHAGI